MELSTSSLAANPRAQGKSFSESHRESPVSLPVNYRGTCFCLFCPEASTNAMKRQVSSKHERKRSWAVGCRFSRLRGITCVASGAPDSPISSLDPASSPIPERSRIVRQSCFGNRLRQLHRALPICANHREVTGRSESVHLVGTDSICLGSFQHQVNSRQAEIKGGTPNFTPPSLGNLDHFVVDAASWQCA